MKINLDNLEISLEEEKNWIRIKVDSDSDSILLENLHSDEVVKIINKNYDIVKAHYYSKVKNEVDITDLKKVCLKIVLRFLHIINIRIRSNKKKINPIITLKCIDNPQMDDIIIQFFKDKYPNDYTNKCEVMLEMSIEMFKAYEKNRQDFNNMF